jgi:hypothetical protein
MLASTDTINFQEPEASDIFMTGSQSLGHFAFGHRRQAGSRVPAKRFGKQQKSKGQDLKSSYLNKDH